MAPAVKGLPAHIKAEAAAWLARLHSDERTVRDEAGFQLWLASDPRNRDAFGLVTTAWDEAGGASVADVPPANGWTRRKLFGAGAAALLTAAGVGLWLYTVPDTYETVRGEQRRIALDDGSILLLDTDSAVQVTMTSDRRMAELDRGRAHFQVAGDVLRPFLVKAQGYDLITDDAVFDVDGRGNGLSLLVMEGSVRARPGNVPAAQTRRIGPRERMQANPGHPPSIDSPALAPLTAWQEGRAIFVALPLRNAVVEMNRYSIRPIIVADPRVMGSAINGSFDVGDSAAFARSAAQQLAVPVQIDSREIVIGHVRLSGGTV